MVHKSLGRDMVKGGTGGGCVDKEDIPVCWGQAGKKNIWSEQGTTIYKHILFVCMYVCMIIVIIISWWIG